MTDDRYVAVERATLEKLSDLALRGSVDKYPTNALHAISRIVDALVPEHATARLNESRESLRSQFGDGFVDAIDNLPAPPPREES